MALYCIMEQYGEMRNDWRPFKQRQSSIKIHTNKKDAKLFYNRYKSFYPKKHFWIAVVDIGIVNK